MHAADLLGAVEIGERARHPQHPMIAARGQPHGVGGVAQQREARRCRAARRLPAAARCAAALVRDPRQAERRVALGLDRAGPRDARRDLAAAFGRRRQDQVGGGDGRHLDVQIDAVEQRPRQPALVVGGAARVRLRACRRSPDRWRGRSGTGSSPRPA